jgi:hypothetical protein
MRKYIATIGAFMMALAIAGCQNPAVTNAVLAANREAKASGLPFRWVSKSARGGTVLTRVMIDIPSGRTQANADQKSYALMWIGKSEAKEGRGAPEIADIKPLGDGREVWILKSTSGIAYVITFKQYDGDAGHIKITGPIEYQKRAG